MNLTMKEHLKTLLTHVSAKQSLWREALQTAVLAYNLGPVVGRSVTPYQAFFGSKPSAFALRSWGCTAFVLLPKAQTTATGPRSLPGMFVGYELHSKAYRIFTGTTVKVARDVRFLEDVNGAAAVGFQDLSTWGPSPPLQFFSTQPSPAQHSCPPCGSGSGPLHAWAPTSPTARLSVDTPNSQTVRSIVCTS
jgi:hypothetical protein